MRPFSPTFLPLDDEDLHHEDGTLFQIPDPFVSS